MAKNKEVGDDRRVGAVRKRSQIKNELTGTWTKRDEKSGKFLDVKADKKPFKGVRKKVKPMAAKKTAARKKTATKKVSAKKMPARKPAKKAAKKSVKRVVKKAPVRKKAAAKRR
jgi:hypothetical protein